MEAGFVSAGRHPDQLADAPAQADVLALIAEARARARRRRRRIALAVVVGIAAAIAVLVMVVRPGPVQVTPARARAVVPVPRTGVVTGYLAACIGSAPLPGHPLPVTPGTVTVVRGQAKLVMKTVRPGEWEPELIIPAGRGEAAEHISDNYQQVFRFVLPPGRYALVGQFDGSHVATGFADVTVVAGKTVRADVPNLCM
jgi:hypothetical protein